MALAGTGASCSRRSERTEAAHPATDRLAPLLDWENATRANTDFTNTPTAATGLGPDPYVIRRLLEPPTATTARSRASDPPPPAFVGILRGRSVVVSLDDALHEIARLPAPESPTGLAVAPNGDVYVVGELAHRVARYRVAHGVLRPAGTIELPDIRAMRDVAAGPEGVVYVVEEHDGRLIALRPATATGARDRAADLPPAEREDTDLCHGPVHVLRVARSLVVDCLLDHAIVVRPVDARGYPQASDEVRVVHDGPMWGMAALEDGDGLLLAVGGVEDHPLDRTQGSFGFVDSFVTLYRVAGGAATRLAQTNTSALGVVTPKALELSRSGPSPGGVTVTVAAYGSDRMATLRYDGDPQRADAWVLRSSDTHALPPGSAMVEAAGEGDLVLANPLLDAWVRVRSDGVAVAPVDDDQSRERSTETRLGEALFFTTLMAPWNSSEGRLSRFTCETCHFEGYVDGRTHHTGREDVHATTKPLLGLFNNRPHFSRALDPDLTTMANNEFRVAGANSGHDSWFSLSRAEFPWLARVGVGDAPVEPEGLRRALMAFLMRFNHRPNPSIVDRSEWTPLERSGAAVFRDKCERCHEARLVTDEPATRVPFDRWESLVMARQGAIVWAHSDYEMTGVTPYVNERGARVVSLRRLYKKYPYFTNGSAKSVRAVLDRVRVVGGRFFHDGAPAAATASGALGEDEKNELAAFLDLL
jgi:hypothetical protein